MNRTTQAASLFHKGANCCQAVLDAFGPEYGLSSPDCMRLGSGFGGGMGLGGTCGAVIGALMVLGLRHGSKRMSAPSAKARAAVADFCTQFESHCGSLICRDLLGCDLSTASGMKHAAKTGLFKTICPGLVQTAAEILESMDQSGRSKPGKASPPTGHSSG